MVSPKKENLLWILEFQGKQKAKHLETLRTSVNIVAQEKVIKACNIARLTWRLPNVEEPHEVMVVTMDVAEDLNGRFEVCLQKNWLSAEHLLHFLD